MLIGTKTEHDLLLVAVRAVVVDEVHAFAGDERGRHLPAVPERLQRLTGRLIQRIGLSATAGNPDALLTWLQGSGAGARPGQVVAPGVVSGSDGTAPAPPAGEVEFDSPGSKPDSRSRQLPPGRAGSSAGDRQTSTVAPTEPTTCTD